MKMLLSCIVVCFCGLAIAASDQDRDGIDDERDICPGVYSRSESGCPTLTPAVTSVSPNLCYTRPPMRDMMLIRVETICGERDGKKTCPKLHTVRGVQWCDPLFPVLFLDGKPWIRGSIYIPGMSL